MLKRQIVDVKAHFSEVLNDAHFLKKTTLVMRRNKAIAVICPIEALKSSVPKAKKKKKRPVVSLRELVEIASLQNPHWSALKDLLEGRK